MENRSFETECGKIEVLAPGVVKIVYFSDLTNLALVKKHMSIIKARCGGDLHILSDVRPIKYVTKEVRRYAAKENPIAKKVAVLTGSGFSKIAGNIFLKFAKPVFPTVLFTDEKKAIDFLMEGR